jgi:hypothetical protein
MYNPKGQDKKTQKQLKVAVNEQSENSWQQQFYNNNNNNNNYYYYY